MKRQIAIGAVAALALVAAWQAAPAIQNVVDPKPEGAIKPAAAPVKPAATLIPKPTPPQPSLKLTPMAERVATIGLLNKRNGLSRDLVMKPGEAVRIGDVVVRLKACEASPSWEQEKLTGAFVQVIVNGSDQKWRKVFSGWLFKESPSLNVVEHPIYDVWTKACAMRFPDTGPETLVVRGGEASPSGGGKSKARKSAPAEEFDDSADDNNDT
jgi:hypothetical protein